MTEKAPQKKSDKQQKSNYKRRSNSKTNNKKRSNRKSGNKQSKKSTFNTSNETDFNRNIINQSAQEKKKKKALSIAELKNWYTKNAQEIEKFKLNESLKQLNIPSKESTTSNSTFSKTKLRQY